MKVSDLIKQNKYADAIDAISSRPDELWLGVDEFKVCAFIHVTDCAIYKLYTSSLDYWVLYMFMLWIIFLCQVNTFKAKTHIRAFLLAIKAQKEEAKMKKHFAPYHRLLLFRWVLFSVIHFFNLMLFNHLGQALCHIKSSISNEFSFL